MELGGDKREKEVNRVGETVVDKMVGTEGKKSAGSLFGFRVSSLRFQVSIFRSPHAAFRGRLSPAG
jgi:hypothetical protein